MSLTVLKSHVIEVCEVEVEVEVASLITSYIRRKVSSYIIFIIYYHISWSDHLLNKFEAILLHRLFLHKFFFSMTK